jgi:transcription elongation factor Elf1
MEVTKHGKFFQEIQCPNCGAYLGVTPSDITTFSSIHEVEGVKKQYKESFINCPECHSALTVDFAFEDVNETVNSDNQ